MTKPRKAPAILLPGDPNDSRDRYVPMGVRSRCKGCGEAILHRKHDTTGKWTVIDARPVSHGNVVLTEDSGYRIVKTGEGSHVSHFATCRDAGKFRNRGEK